MADNSVWTIKGRKVLLDGKPFFANGVSYSPVPWGGCTAFEPYGDFTITAWESVWQRDLPLMHSNSINVLKTYNTLDAVQTQNDHDHGPFLAACWNSGSSPIFVLMGYAPPKNQQAIFLSATWSNPENIAARDTIKGNLVALAKEYGSYPAVMGFVMANELNADNIIDNPQFFIYWNDVANAIAAVAPAKLTALANVDDSMNTVRAGSQYLTADNFFWAYNSYRGNWTNSNSFDNLFSTFAAAASKPLMLTEWGAPASTHDAQSQITPMTDSQMKDLVTYVNGHYMDQIAHRSDTGTASDSVCCGGTYFEWSDEWWKADPAGKQCNQPGAAPECHTGIWDPGPNMHQLPDFPGDYWDEEGFGLHGLEPVDPKNRKPVVAGGCVGPWNPDTNSPYPPDHLTMRPHAVELFKLFGSHRPGG
jgi:hypothetical protein